MNDPGWPDPHHYPDPLSAPLSERDTDQAPPNPEELAYQRRIHALAGPWHPGTSESHPITAAALQGDCAAQFNAWMGRSARRHESVAEHFRRQAVVTPAEVTALIDVGLFYAYVDREGIDDVTSDVGEDSELAAYARFAAYLETDGVKS